MKIYIKLLTFNDSRADEAVARCQNSPSGGPASSPGLSLLLCCFRDLCNHEDSPVARARLNLTLHEGKLFN